MTGHQCTRCGGLLARVSGPLQANSDDCSMVAGEFTGHWVERVSTRPGSLTCTSRYCGVSFPWVPDPPSSYGTTGAGSAPPGGYPKYNYTQGSNNNLLKPVNRTFHGGERLTDRRGFRIPAKIVDCDD